MSKISIVVPIYNVEKYLRRCLESIQNQTFDDFDVYCVNDGSPDNSQAIIDEFVSKDARFHGLIKKNGGLSDARNYGMKYVDSEYILFVDSDDFIEPNLLMTCYKKMIQDNLDCVVFSYNRYYIEKDFKEENKLNIAEGVYNIKDNPEILAYTPNAAWNKMYKFSVFKNNQIEFPFGLRQEDLGTTPRVLYCCDKVGVIHDALYNYLVDRPNNISQMVDEKIYHIHTILNIIYSFYKEKGCFEKYKDELSYLGWANLNFELRKAVQLKDKKFVYKYIDDTFELMETNFGKGIEKKYPLVFTKSDKIYYSRFLCKAYYVYKNRKGS